MTPRDGPTAVGGDLPLDGGFQRDQCGRESTNVNAYAIRDMIVVVVRWEHLTQLEQLVVDGGETERVLAVRADFARVMAIGAPAYVTEYLHSGRCPARCRGRRGGPWRVEE